MHFYDFLCILITTLGFLVPCFLTMPLLIRGIAILNTTICTNCLMDLLSKTFIQINDLRCVDTVLVCHFCVYSKIYMKIYSTNQKKSVYL